MSDGVLPIEGATGRLPGPHTIRAALRVAWLIDVDGSPLPALRASYLNVVSGGVFGRDDLVRGEGLLLSLGLLSEEAEHLRRDARAEMLCQAPEEQAEELLLSMVIENAPPLWLGAAVGDGELRPEMIRDDDAKTLKRLFPDAEERERFLINQGSRVDPTAMKRLGDLGERLVFETYQAMATEAGGDPNQVVWVAQFSDAAGYDVSAPRDWPGKHLLEVKTSRSVGSTFPVQVSRHEIETGKDFPEEWSLVACRADASDVVKVVGWTTVGALLPLLPQDQHESARWASVKIELKVEELKPGLPPLGRNPKAEV